MNTVVRKMTAAQDAPANPAPRRNVGLGLMLVADEIHRGGFGGREVAGPRIN